MIKNIVGFLAMMFVGVLILSQNAFASSIEFPKLEQPVFVQDHAGIITDQDKDEIAKKGQKLQDGTDSDILVMTMKSIGQTPKEDYAYEAGRHYKVGDQKHSRGVVILVNLDNDNEYNNKGIQVAVGRGLEGILNDAKVGELIDENFMPYAKKASNANNKEEAKAYYSEGIKKLYNAIWNDVAKAYGYDGKQFKEKEPRANEKSGDSFLEIFGFIFIIVVIIIIIFSKNGKGGPPRGGGRRRDDSGTWWVGSGGFDSGGFGGSSSGGFGGGFGGGGDFGGGGAGRSF